MPEYKHDNATFHIDNGGEARLKIAYHGETGYIKVNLLELIGSPQAVATEEGRVQRA